VSILYCAIPHFCAALAQRERGAPGLSGAPGPQPDALVLIGPEGRVLDASAHAAACGVVPGLTARGAQIRCPQARLVDADLATSRQALEALWGVLERTSDDVEPHGWGAAYVDLGDLSRDRAGAVALCSETGRAIRRELGAGLEPALGWNSSKFTAQAAARRTRPGRLLAVPAAQERTFLDPLPVGLLPLEGEALDRLRFLGLRTLGQYAALPPGAVWQQFGRAGVLAQRCAQGADDRPVVSRHRAPCLDAAHAFEVPEADLGRLLAACKRLVRPLLGELRESLRACSQVRLMVQYEDGSVQECTRTLVSATSSPARVAGALEGFLHDLAWPAPAIELRVTLEQIQEAVLEQLSFLPGEGGGEEKLRQVQRYLAGRFGANCLQQAILAQPNAPLPEWRVGWNAAVPGASP
jgi:protein ImuB